MTLAVIPSVRTVAKEQGIDLNVLLGILKLRRPDNSKTEMEFVDALEVTLGSGVKSDAFGNLWLVVGDNPTTMWSCHTDTVSKTDGHQNLTWDGDTLALHEGKPGQSLGADDGAGLWLMLQMIQAKKPGLYIFHRAEEVGGKGSAYLVRNHKEIYDGIKRAIAFDRRGTTSVITRQGYDRTCSDEFGRAVADALNDAEPLLKYKIDDTGSFTDTKNYADDISECTNISVGYENEHGPKETLDVAHLLRLRAAVLAVDFEAIDAVREPGDTDDLWGSGGWGNYSHSRYTRGPLEELIVNRSYTLAQIFKSQGLSVEDVDQMCDEYWTQQKDRNLFLDDDDDDEFVSVLFCNECVQQAPPFSAAVPWHDGDKCPNCCSVDTEAFELRQDQLD